MAFPETVRIVLVEPESPGNIGAAARAMKTMGLARLWLVAPQCDPRAEEALRMAHNAEEILEQTRVVETLEEALAGTGFSVATSQRLRRQDIPFYTPEEVAEMALERAAEHDVALVFGRESSGLTNHELSLCSALSMAPSATRLPALNLAQAVMVYSYVMYQASLRPEERHFQWHLAAHEELEQFYAHLAQTLTGLGAHPATTLEAYIDKFRRIFSRIPLESRDVNLLHKLLEEMA
jgi:TrmH family RNA methyltransferase